MRNRWTGITLPNASPFSTIKWINGASRGKPKGVGSYRVIHTVVDADQVIIVPKVAKRDESTYRDLNLLMNLPSCMQTTDPLVDSDVRSELQLEPPFKVYIHNNDSAVPEKNSSFHRAHES